MDEIGVARGDGGGIVEWEGEIGAVAPSFGSSVPFSLILAWDPITDSDPPWEFGAIGMFFFGG